MTNIKIRPCADGEEELVACIHNLGFKEWIDTLGNEYSYSHVSSKDVSHWLKDSPLDMLWIAEFAGLPVGYAHCRLTKLHLLYVPTESDMGQSKIAVIPEYRRRGVGRALIQRTSEYYKAKGAETAEAVAYSDNKAASALLESTGFVGREAAVFAEIDLKKPLKDIKLNPEVVVREAREEDADALIRIFIESATWFPRERISRDWVLSWLKKTDTALVAEYKCQIVGLMAFYRNHGLDLPGVIPKYRRKGIGYTLFFHLLRDMQKKEYPKAIADTGLSQNGAIKMYSRFDFSIARKHYAWTKTLRN